MRDLGVDQVLRLLYSLICPPTGKRMRSSIGAQPILAMLLSSVAQFGRHCASIPRAYLAARRPRRFQIANLLEWQIVVTSVEGLAGHVFKRVLQAAWAPTRISPSVERAQSDAAQTD
jgi:hypothetical protein